MVKIGFLLPGAVAHEEMMKSKLPSSVLQQIWVLLDTNQDGQLDRDEFAVAMFLVDHKLQGNDLPDTLPDRLVPPSKRDLRHQGGGGAGGSGRMESSTSSGHSSGFPYALVVPTVIAVIAVVLFFALFLVN